MANIPNNLVLTASRGGSQDELIEKHNLREAVVVYSEEAAAEKGLEIDSDDSHAADPASQSVFRSTHSRCAAEGSKQQST